MDLHTLCRVIFLISLGIHLLLPNEFCRIAAGASGFLLGLWLLIPVLLT